MISFQSQKAVVSLYGENYLKIYVTPISKKLSIAELSIQL